MKQREIAGIKVFVSNEDYEAYKGTLQEQIEEKDKEIERLNNIIEELEKYLVEYRTNIENPDFYEEGIIDCLDEVLDKLKKLKEGGKGA